MTSDGRENIEALSPEEIAHLLRKADAVEALPVAISDDAPGFLRALYNAWVEKGGQISGKPRNSLRQITDLLKSNESSVASIQQKLAGQVKLTKEDVFALVKLFLSHWEYAGSSKEKRASSENYNAFPDIDIQKFCEDLARVMFPEGRKGILLPPRSGQKSVKTAQEVFAEGFPTADALFTVSCHRTILAPTLPARFARFRRAINQFWDIDRQGDHERVLIWIVDMGSRRFDDEDALTAFGNVETLAAACRALALFDDPEAEERWRWLNDHAVFVVGSLRSAEIDKWQGKISQSDEMGTSWPFISSQHVLLGALPPEWVGASELPIIYGPRLEEFDNRAFTIFLRENGWNEGSDTKQPRRLRYFAYGPAPTERGYRDLSQNQASAVSLELSSPELSYDQAFQLVYSAAAYRIRKGISEKLEVEFPPVEAINHLRRLGFAVLSLDQFVRLAENLDPR